MTMTESAPASITATPAPPAAVAGLYDLLTTTDHKRIGKMWLGSGVLFLLGAVAVGLLVGIERLDDASVDVFGGDNAFFQMWALYRLGLALLVVAPLFLGLGLILVPLQVGSTNIAFPRAALASAWGFVLGAGIMVVAVLAGGGWGAWDRATGDERDAVALTLVGMGLVIVSILLASICVATTVISLRTEGMSLERTPLFAWSMLVAASVWLFTLPMAIANLIIAYVDLHNGPGNFGGGGAEGLSGSRDAIYSQVSWLVEQPQVYAFAIPVLGILGSVAPVAAGARPRRHGLSMALIGLFGVVAHGSWSQAAFQSTGGAGVDYDERFLFIAFGIAAVVPVLGAIGGAADALFRSEGNVAGIPPAHLLGALGGGILLLAATAAGAARVIEPFELGGRITVSGVMNLAFVGAITAAVGGLWFWAPKIVGRQLPAVIGRLVVLDLVVGGLLLGGAQVANGFFGTRDNPLEVATDDVAEVLHVVALIGGVLIALGALGVVAAVARALQRGRRMPDDPWGGHTLEWTTTSPPPPGNFAEHPALVRSAAPLLDRPADETADGGDAGGED